MSLKHVALWFRKKAICFFSAATHLSPQDAVGGVRLLGFLLSLLAACLVMLTSQSTPMDVINQVQES